MYPVNNDQNMMVRRNQDEYPQYVKNEEGVVGFHRNIELTEKSQLKAINETDYHNKTSSVHLASVMKAKNNGKNTQVLTQFSMFNNLHLPFVCV